MNCEEAVLLMIARQAPGEEDARALEAHLDECNACRVQATYLHWVRRELEALPTVPAPAGLGERVLARTRGRRPRVAATADVKYTRFDSPMGDLFVAYGEGGIVRAAFSVSESEFVSMLKAEGREAVPQPEAPSAVARAVASYVESGRCRPDAFDLRLLGEFERRVLLKALEIPRGEVRSYNWIAREIGSAGASRAVGQALGRNPIPLLIPCHRAVRSDGGLGGYAFGLEAKRKLLDAEGVELVELARDAALGVRFLASRTTGIFCLPTCRHARRIAPANRVSLRSELEARAGGFRPCRVCRPVAAPVAP